MAEQDEFESYVPTGCTMTTGALRQELFNSILDTSRCEFSSKQHQELMRRSRHALRCMKEDIKNLKKGGQS